MRPKAMKDVENAAVCSKLNLHLVAVPLEAHRFIHQELTIENGLGLVLFVIK